VVSKPRPENDEDQYADYMEHMQHKNLPGTTEARFLEQTRCHILAMMFAGHETTASTILFAVKYISENPEVLAALQVPKEKEKLTCSSSSFLLIISLHHCKENSPCGLMQSVKTQSVIRNQPQ
jgi:hypothetical protein